MALKDLISKNDRDTAAADAVERLHVAQQRREKLNNERQALERERDDLKQQIGQMNDDAEAKKKWRRISEIRDELGINEQRQSQAARDADQAEVELHRVRAADKLKTGRRKATMRSKAGQKMSQGIALVYEGWSELHQEADKLTQWGGTDLTINHGGTMLSRAEIRAVVEQELMRVSAPQALDGKAVPPLPGVRPALFAGDPKKLPSLTDVIEQANATLLRRIEAGPVAPSPKPEPQHSEPAPAIVPDADVRPSDPTMAAEQIMAGVVPRKLEV